MRESQTVEFKKSFSDEEEILKTICAFSNAKGGTIYIGVADNGRFIGVHKGKNTIENLVRHIREYIVPSPSISFQNIYFEDKEIVKIIVKEGISKPYFYKGIAYIRIGKTNRRMDPSEIKELIKKEILSKEHFDEQLNNFANLEHIDESSLKKFCKVSKKPWKGKQLTLKNLLLLRNNRLLNAAILFFSKEPSFIFPLYGIKIAIFKGNEMVALKDFSQNIMNIVEPAINFIEQNIPKKIDFSSVVRKEVPIIPRDVLRESIINALVHRDYFIDSSIHIMINEKEIRIKNPGELPDGLTLSSLYKPHPSLPRNPLLAQLAMMAGFIEHWGSGTLRMISSMRSVGLRDPLFLSSKGFFEVVLRFDKFKLNKRQEKILSLLNAKHSVTIKDLRKNFSVTDRTLRNDLKVLAEKGLVYRHSRGPKTFYSLYSILSGNQ